MANINFDTANTGYGGNYGGGSYPMPYPIYCNNNDNDNNWTDLAALALVTGDGFGRRGRGDDCCDDKCCTKMIDMHDHHDDHNHEMDGIHGVEKEVCAAERQAADLAMMLQKCCCDTDKDILEAKYDLGNNILETKFDLDRDILTNRFESTVQFKDLTHDVDLQSCGINRNIDSVKFNQQIIAKDAAMQLADCCCELKEKIRDSADAAHADADATRALINKNEFRNLERELAELRAEKRNRAVSDTIVANIGSGTQTLTNTLNDIIDTIGGITTA